MKLVCSVYFDIWIEYCSGYMSQFFGVLFVNEIFLCVCFGFCLVWMDVSFVVVSWVMDWWEVYDWWSLIVVVCWIDCICSDFGWIGVIVWGQLEFDYCVDDDW